MIRATKDNTKAIKAGILNQWIRLDGKLQGLAAIQLGYPVRFFMMRNPRTKEQIYVSNPEVLFKFGLRLSDEGCLSIPQTRSLVWRPWFVVAKWDDKDGNSKLHFLGSKQSRIFMHEYDHLQGITIYQKGVNYANPVS